MSNDVPDVNQVRLNGWRQGSILPQTLVDTLLQEQLLPANASGDRFIVISHDCDVVNRSLEVEPKVELLRAIVLPPEGKDGNLTWGKNARTCQLEVSASGQQEIWQFAIQDRYFLPRIHLIDFCPDSSPTLDDEQIRVLKHWLTRRYVRAAFPDAFVARADQAKEKLRKSLKSKGKHLTAIYVVVPDKELDDATPYEILIKATMFVDDHADPQKIAEAQKGVDAVEAALGSCPGIKVKQSVLVSESDVTIDDRRYLKRWDFDDLTVRGASTSDLPADE